MSDDSITSDWFSLHKNAFEAYGGNHWISDELHRLIRVDLLLTTLTIDIHGCAIWPEDCREIADSYAFVFRGSELTRSAIFLAVSNYQPAPFFLLRSAVNCFWFAYCAMTNREFHQGKKTFRFYDRYDDPAARLSPCEISTKELERITGNRIDGRSIIDDLNAYLHNSRGSSLLWERSEDLPPAFPSPVVLGLRAQGDVVNGLIGHLRGLQELHRSVLEAIFVEADPEKIWSVYSNEGMRDDGEAVMRLIEKVRGLGKIDLRKLPRP